MSWALVNTGFAATGIGVFKCVSSFCEKEKRQADIDWRIGKMSLAIGLGSLALGFGLHYLTRVTPVAERNVTVVQGQVTSETTRNIIENALSTASLAAAGAETVGRAMTEVVGDALKKGLACPQLQKLKAYMAGKQPSEDIPHTPPNVAYVLDAAHKAYGLDCNNLLTHTWIEAYYRNGRPGVEITKEMMPPNTHVGWFFERDSTNEERIVLALNYESCIDQDVDYGEGIVTFYGYKEELTVEMSATTRMTPSGSCFYELFRYNDLYSSQIDELFSKGSYTLTDYEPLPKRVSISKVANPLERQKVLRLGDTQRMPLIEPERCPITLLRTYLTDVKDSAIEHLFRTANETGLITCENYLPWRSRYADSYIDFIRPYDVGYRGVVWVIDDEGRPGVSFHVHKNGKTAVGTYSQRYSFDQHRVEFGGNEAGFIRDDLGWSYDKNNQERTELWKQFIRTGKMKAEEDDYELVKKPDPKPKKESDNVLAWGQIIP